MNNNLSNNQDRTIRKTLIGVVDKCFGDKSVRVVFFYKKRHPLFRKEIKSKTVFYVHDEKNECSIGDKVEIMSTRPLSKMKRWRIVRLLEKFKNNVKA